MPDMVSGQKQIGWNRRLILWAATTFAVFSAFAASGLAPLDVKKLMPARSTETESGANIAKSSSIPKASQAPLETSFLTGQAKIFIRRLGIASPIVFPASTDLNELKQALDQGAVHYPLSSFPNESSGNVFIFGHSSSRPFEKNPSRTVFTRLNQLEPGNEIEIQYGGRSYRYRVTSVKILKPDQAEVYFVTPKRMLTLSTCWPIGDPSNRFVVEAEFTPTPIKAIH